MKKTNSYFKNIFMMITMSLVLISCGQDNKSGQPNNSVGNFGTITGFGNTGAIGGFNYSGIRSGNGLTLPSNWLQIIAQENTCRTPNFGFQTTVNTQERVRFVVDLTGFNVNAGAAHIGVTVEGDIAIISLQAQGPVMEILACNRPDLSPNVRPTGNLVVNTSNTCPVSEITSADVVIPSSLGFGGYQLDFFPIHIPGTQQSSSLCFNGF